MCHILIYKYWYINIYNFQAYTKVQHHRTFYCQPWQIDICSIIKYLETVSVIIVMHSRKTRYFLLTCTYPSALCPLVPLLGVGNSKGTWIHQKYFNPSNYYWDSLVSTPASQHPTRPLCLRRDDSAMPDISVRLELCFAKLYFKPSVQAFSFSFFLSDWCILRTAPQVCPRKWLLFSCSSPKLSGVADTEHHNKCKHLFSTVLQRL